MNTENLRRAIDDVENAGQIAAIITALAFTTWDSFENGGFKQEINDYAPLLRLMHEQASALKQEIENAVDSLWEAVREGATT